jgi:hypothetical protein
MVKIEFVGHSLDLVNASMIHVKICLIVNPFNAITKFGATI